MLRWEHWMYCVYVTKIRTKILRLYYSYLYHWLMSVPQMIYVPRLWSVHHSTYVRHSTYFPQTEFSTYHRTMHLSEAFWRTVCHFNREIAIATVPGHSLIQYKTCTTKRDVTGTFFTIKRIDECFRREKKKEKGCTLKYTCLAIYC